MRITAVFALLCTFSTSANAEPPKVVTDIAPVHGLVSMVMDGVSNADVLLKPNASAHDLALRPSQASQVAQADLIIWIGASLTPQLTDTFATLAPEAALLSLDSSPATAVLGFRELEDFGEAEDDHDHDHDHDHAHEDGIDPHVWLDPDNATAWLSLIAEELAKADPEHAATYYANAQSATADITELKDEIAAQLAKAPQSAFLVSHDAFQYFENRFDRSAIGAVSLSDAVPPSPKHLAELRGRIEQSNVSCVLVEPLTNIGLIDAVAGQTDLRAVEVDPLGAGLLLGTSFYPTLLQHMGEAFIDCVTPVKRG